MAISDSNVHISRLTTCGAEGTDNEDNTHSELHEWPTRNGIDEMDFQMMSAEMSRKEQERPCLGLLVF